VAEARYELYTGAYELTIDEKNRLSIPAKIRNRMHPDTDGTGFYLVLGLRAGTLSLYADRYFRVYAERLAAEMAFGEEQQTFEALFFSKCAELEIDKQGRVTLPEHMLEAAKIGRAVYLTGARDHLDLWNKDHYLAFVRETQDRIMELRCKAHAKWDRTARL